MVGLGFLLARGLVVLRRLISDLSFDLWCMIGAQGVAWGYLSAIDFGPWPEFSPHPRGRDV